MIAVGNAVKIGDAVLAAMATITIVGCGGSNSPVTDAKTYVRTIGPDAAQVETYQIKVGLDILNNDPTGLAQDAQAAHDASVNVKTDIIGAGNNVSDNNRLGTAELQMDDAINELKNGMGAVVAFTENPDAGTLGAANSTSGQGITDWDRAATVLWTMAGQASQVPTLAGSTPASTNTSAATPSAATPNPANSAVPSWVRAARQGCPAGEVLSKTLSNGETAPYGNDGCVSSGPPTSAPPHEPTCDPANAPSGTPATQTTTATSAPLPPTVGSVGSVPVARQNGTVPCVTQLTPPIE
jgi:hypothetical protein